MLHSTPSSRLGLSGVTRRLPLSFLGLVVVCCFLFSSSSFVVLVSAACPTGAVVPSGRLGAWSGWLGASCPSVAPTPSSAVLCSFLDSGLSSLSVSYSTVPAGYIMVSAVGGQCSSATATTPEQLATVTATGAATATSVTTDAIRNTTGGAQSTHPTMMLYSSTSGSGMYALNKYGGLYYYACASGQWVAGWQGFSADAASTYRGSFTAMRFFCQKAPSCDRNVAAVTVTAANPTAYVNTQQCTQWEETLSGPCYSPCAAGAHWVASALDVSKCTSPSFGAQFTGCSGVGCAATWNGGAQSCQLDSPAYSMYKTCASGYGFAIGCYSSSLETSGANHFLASDSLSLFIIAQQYSTCAAAGFSSSFKEASGCVKCPVGFYSDPTNGINTCTACPAGTYSNVAGASSGSQCGAGQTSITGSTSCVSGCVPPSLVMNSTLHQCLPCATGYYTLSSSSTACVRCAAGKYSTVTPGQGLSCTNCQNHFYNPNEGQSVCQACAAGTATATTGTVNATGCVPCAAGYYDSWNQISQPNGKCALCAAHSYSEAGATQCTACPLGTYTTATGAKSISDCLLCPVGTYDSSTATTPSTSGCTKCSSHYYNDQLGQTSCSVCSAGTYTQQTGAASAADCLPCAAGSYDSFNAASNPSGGRNFCPRHYYSYERSTSCSVCDAGTYTASTGTNNVTLCLPCAGGTYDSFNAATNPTGGCNLCAKHYWSYERSTTCTVCEMGTYTASTGTNNASLCLSCAIGTYDSFNAATNLNGGCVACPSHYFNDVTRQSSCKVCGAGTYTAATGSTNVTDCLPCAAGRYDSFNAATNPNGACVLCTSHTYSYGGTASCEICPSGTYTAALGTKNITDCLPCPAGTFDSYRQMSNPNGICEKCPGHSYSAGGRDACDECPSGTFTAALGSSSISNCTLCAAGTFDAWPSTHVRTTTCQTCAGHYYSSSGVTECTACVAGTYTSSSVLATSASSCIKCAVGTYDPFSSSNPVNGCAACGARSISPQTGATACQQCVAASHSGDSNIQPEIGIYAATRCLCNAGYYEPTTSISSDPTNPNCLACSPGTYQPSSGNLARQCWSCSPGSHASDAASAKCFDCGVKYFSAQYGAAECDECGDYAITNRLRTSCTTCTDDQVSTDDGMTCEGLSSAASATIISNYQKSITPSVVFVYTLLLGYLCFRSVGCGALCNIGHKWRNIIYILGCNAALIGLVGSYLFFIYNLNQVLIFKVNMRHHGFDYDRLRSAALTFLVFETIWLPIDAFMGFRRTFNAQCMASRKTDCQDSFRNSILPGFLIKDLPNLIFQCFFLTFASRLNASFFQAFCMTIISLVWSLKALHSAYKAEDSDPDPDKMGMDKYIAVTIEGVIDSIKSCCCEDKEETKRKKEAKEVELTKMANVGVPLGPAQQYMQPTGMMNQSPPQNQPPPILYNPASPTNVANPSQVNIHLSPSPSHYSQPQQQYVQSPMSQQQFPPQNVMMPQPIGMQQPPYPLPQQQQQPIYSNSPPAQYVFQPPQQQYQQPYPQQQQQQPMMMAPYPPQQQNQLGAPPGYFTYNQQQQPPQQMMQPVQMHMQPQQQMQPQMQQQPPPQFVPQPMMMMQSPAPVDPSQQPQPMQPAPLSVLQTPGSASPPAVADPTPSAQVVSPVAAAAETPAQTPAAQPTPPTQAEQQPQQQQKEEEKNSGQI